MKFRTPLAPIAVMALAVTLAQPFLAADAMAAKERFQRTKPHVNVGTIGHVDQDGPSALATPDDNGTTSPDPNPDDNNCKPDPSKPADAQSC
jgi:hypothetical protein